MVHLPNGCLPERWLTHPSGRPVECCENPMAARGHSWPDLVIRQCSPRLRRRPNTRREDRWTCCAGHSFRWRSTHQLKATFRGRTQRGCETTQKSIPLFLAGPFGFRRFLLCPGDLNAGESLSRQVRFRQHGSAFTEARCSRQSAAGWALNVLCSVDHRNSVRRIAPAFRNGRPDYLCY